MHQSRAWADVEIQTIYIEPDRVPSYPATCRLIRASSLLEALMDEAVRMPVDYDEDGRDGQLVDLLLGEIGRMPEVLLHVPIPLDPRLARICEAVIADTSSDLTLDDWADRSGISRRTLTRMFRRETGQSFSAWRQRVRLLEALARLGAGKSVTNVALDVGYDSPSAFTAMFRRELGAAPRRYLRWADRRSCCDNRLPLDRTGFRAAASRDRRQIAIATATAIREIHQFMAQWRDRTTSTFDCEKTPVSATRGMAVTNHPLASAAALEIMAQGGNAVDATVAALFTLTVVEPMMVGIFGGGTAVIRLADGRELVIDGLATAPAMTRPDSYTPVSDTWPDYMETEGRANRVGAKAIAVPGNLMAWCEIARRFGKLDLPTLMEPAIRHAARGFEVTPYLATCIEETAIDLALDPAIAAIFLPDGKPLRAGSRLIQSDYAETLRTIAQSGPGVMYGGELGRAIAGKLEQAGSFIRLEDLANYRTIEREPVRGTYRGVEIIGPPPPCSGGVHTIQILNILKPLI